MPRDVINRHEDPPAPIMPFARVGMASFASLQPCAHQHNDTAHNIASTDVSSGVRTAIGRQVALLVFRHMSSSKPATIAPENDEQVVLLKKSGRWVERLVATYGGHKHIVVAVPYGFSGASCDKSKEVENETIIGAALVRMQQLGRVPYFILTDLNMDPNGSRQRMEARRAGLAYDVAYD